MTKYNVHFRLNALGGEGPSPPANGDLIVLPDIPDIVTEFEAEDVAITQTQTISYSSLTLSLIVFLIVSLVVGYNIRHYYVKYHQVSGKREDAGIEQQGKN